MGKIRIVTDSTAYLTPELMERHGITVVPLTVNFNNESYPEGTVYTNRDFFSMVDKSPELPTTSQPSAGAFVEAFDKLHGEGADAIIGIFISSELSGTYSSAKTAQEIVGRSNIYLIDSRFTVNAMRYMVIAAAEMAEKGKDVDEILTALNKMKRGMKLYFVVQTLDYLHKGGRIGGAAALFGTLLQVKPILYLPDGKIDLFEKVRTKGKAWARVVEELDKSMASGRPHWIGILHVSAYAEAEQLVKELKSKYPNQQIDFEEAGQVIGSHVGPGTVGLCFYPL